MTKVVIADENGAEVMVRLPYEEAGATCRRFPKPDSMVMAVSADGSISPSGSEAP